MSVPAEQIAHAATNADTTEKGIWGAAVALMLGAAGYFRRASREKSHAELITATKLGEMENRMQMIEEGQIKLSNSLEGLLKMWEESQRLTAIATQTHEKVVHLIEMNDQKATAARESITDKLGSVKEILVQVDSKANQALLAVAGLKEGHK